MSRKPIHESPRTAYRAITAAMERHTLDVGQSIGELLEAIRGEALADWLD